LASAIGVGWVGVELALVGLAFYWRRRGRRAGGGRRPGLAAALWIFAGLVSMVLLYKMLGGLDAAGDALVHGREVASRSAQALVFYGLAAWLTCRPPVGEAAGGAASR
jgi:multisubunit Na+/H+ antiporter MnhB subunit